LSDWSSDVCSSDLDDFIDAANRVENPLRHFLQRARSGEMAVEVVDHLQVIEVEEDDAEERAVAACALHLFIEIRLEESAIERFRQIVAHGEIAAARQLINVAEDLRDGAEVTADGVSVGVLEFMIARDRNAD